MIVNGAFRLVGVVVVSLSLILSGLPANGEVGWSPTHEPVSIPLPDRDVFLSWANRANEWLDADQADVLRNSLIDALPAELRANAEERGSKAGQQLPNKEAVASMSRPDHPGTKAALREQARVVEEMDVLIAEIRPVTALHRSLREFRALIAEEAALPLFYAIAHSERSSDFWEGEPSDDHGPGDEESDDGASEAAPPPGGWTALGGLAAGTAFAVGCAFVTGGSATAPCIAGGVAVGIIFTAITLIQLSNECWIDRFWAQRDGPTWISFEVVGKCGVNKHMITEARIFTETDPFRGTASGYHCGLTSTCGIKHRVARPAVTCAEFVGQVDFWDANNPGGYDTAKWVGHRGAGCF